MRYLTKIKSFLLSSFCYPLKRSFKFGKCHKAITIILLTGLGLISALIISAVSQPEVTNQPQLLVKKGEQYYEQGQLEQAISAWKKAAEFYDLEGDNKRRAANLINTATAQQALGLYEESCDTVLEAFNIQETDCFQLLDDAQSLEQRLQAKEQVDIFPEADSSFAFLQPLVEEPYNLSQATGLLRLGDYFTNSNYPQVARTAINRSLQIAIKLENPRQKTAAFLSLGNTIGAIAKQEQNQLSPQNTALKIILPSQFLGKAELEPEEKALKTYNKAIDYYKKAAESAKLPLNRLKAEINHLRTLLDIQEFWLKALNELPDSDDDFIKLLGNLGITDRSFIQETINNRNNLESGLKKELQPQIDYLTKEIRSQLNTLPTNHAGVFALINFAESLIRQEILDEDTDKILKDAIEYASKLNNSILEAQANSYLGYFYEQQQQYQQARKYTVEALKLTPTNEYPEITYRWHAQLGRIIAQQNDREAALGAYKTSFQTINTLRSELATTSVHDIFREYLNLLLQEEPTGEELIEAREVLELLQITELDNFFRDPCSPIAEEIPSMGNVDSNAAVIYPIIFQDRLEVIVALPKLSSKESQDSLKVFTTKISREKVTNTIDKLLSEIFENPGFAEVVRNARGDSQPGEDRQSSPEEIQIALEELQKSLNKSLNEEILPLAKEIYDWLIGEIEDKLIFQEHNIKTLVFVLDGPLRNLPMSLLYDGEKYLIEKNYNIVLTSGLRLTNLQPLKSRPIKVLAAGTTKGDDNFGFSEIPEVNTELDLIEELFPSEVLREEQFTFENLRAQLDQTDYSIVHLATHGKFGSTPDRTFILSGSEADTKDRYINVKEFDTLLKIRDNRNSQPIELLVLSACQTAKGDNRAILGLAGVAVKAGARSTIAALWNAEDKAASELMGYFYKNLQKNQKIPKVEALRYAQLELLQKPEYRHPYYWAPFAFIGNWT